jgi:plastocyanin
MKRFVLLSTLVIAAGPARAEPAKRPAPAPVVATGGIKGTVIFEGEAPERKKLVRDTDPYCAKIDKLADDVVVTKGKLRDVLVRVKNGSAGTHPAPAAPVVIDQHECMYSPRVVGLVAGQKLALRNSDGTFHNVHGTIAGKLVWNKPHAAKDPDLALDPAAKPGDVLDIVCDVHPWMHSYAVVQDHPFFAVTGEDGAFEIKGLAAGTYTLEAWHPTLGSKTLTVKIGTGAKSVVPARISYKANER